MPSSLTFKIFLFVTQIISENVPNTSHSLTHNDALSEIFVRFILYFALVQFGFCLFDLQAIEFVWNDARPIQNMVFIWFKNIDKMLYIKKFCEYENQQWKHLEWADIRFVYPNLFSVFLAFVFICHVRLVKRNFLLACGAVARHFSHNICAWDQSHFKSKFDAHVLNNNVFFFLFVSSTGFLIHLTFFGRLSIQ